MSLKYKTHNLQLGHNNVARSFIGSENRQNNTKHKLQQTPSSNVS